VPRPIRSETDAVEEPCRVGVELPGQHGADALHKLEISNTHSRRDVVNRSYRALLQEEEKGPAVVLHEQPVTPLSAVPVYRDFLSHQKVADHERDQLLGVLVGAVVVGAAGDEHREAIRPAVCKTQ
jgi:hypothetical protein